MITAMRAPLAPGLLLAMPELRDPNFFRAVILLCAHTSEGAFGLIVNHALDVDVATICAEASVPWPHDAAPPAFCGGPCDRQRGWVLHDPDLRFSDSQFVHDGLALSASRDALKAYARDPRGRFRLILGYAGWDAGQLDAEVAAGSWVPAPLDADTLFRLPPARLWSTTLEGLGIHDSTRLVGGSSRVH